MKTTGNTILITGGSAGIGLALATTLSELGNKVIITGRNKERLIQASNQLKNVTPIVSDVSNSTEVTNLVSQLSTEYPNLNMVINNAGNAKLYDLIAEGANAYSIAQEEMLVNYLSIIRLNENLFPLLKRQDSAAIVTISSIVAFVPGKLVTYSASKAALHSYTQGLRIALENETNIKVFEVMPPLVDTDFSAPIGGKNGIPASEVSTQFVSSLANDEYEIRVGFTEELYRLYLSSPQKALLALNS